MKEIKYIELKTDYADDGPAWIALVKFSKSGQTIYFDGKAFQKCGDASGNYRDIETGEVYWISSVKKNGADRHWAGGGMVSIAKNIVDDYLQIVGARELDKNHYLIVDLPEDYPIERIHLVENQKNE